MKNQMYEIVQQTQYINTEQIENGLKNGFKSISQYAYILHDKDQNADGTPKAAHYHIYLRFYYSVDSKTVANWFNIEEQYINKIKGRFVDACLYANHSNAPDKYQYDIKSIIANFDVGAYQKTKENSMTKKQEVEYIEDIIDRICSGEIRYYELNDHVKGRLFTKYATRLMKAFDYYHLSWCNQCRNNEIEVWFFDGGTGNGKTTIAQGVAESIIEQGKYKGICVSSSSNDPLQDYKGEDFLLLDDMRDNSFTYQDLLKLLDNNIRSSAKSRFCNKMFYGKYIFITSCVPLSDWYKGVKEDKKQLHRRITKYFKVMNDKIEEYNIDKGNLSSMSFVRSFRNFVSDFAKAKDEQGQMRTEYDLQKVFEAVAKTFNIELTDEQRKQLLSSVSLEEELPF